MTEQKKYLPKWAEAEFSQLKAKIAALEADNATLRGEIDGEAWGWVSASDQRHDNDIPVLGSKYGKKYRKVEIGSTDESKRWEIQLDEENNLVIRSPYFSNSRMVVLPSVTNVIEVKMVEGLR